MNEATVHPPAPALAPRGGSWSNRKLVCLIALAFAAHVTLIFIFGSKNQIQPRAVKNVPQFRLADKADELIALGNPVLFVLPNPRDFAAAIWLKIPDVPPPPVQWTEEPRWLQPVVQNPGAALNQFLQTNDTGGVQFNFKPPPQFASPDTPVESALPENSTIQILGDLAQRKLLAPPALPSLPVNDVIAPSKVQVVVDPAGNVFSSVLLPSENPVEALGRAEIGDSNALAIARSLRFAPAAAPTLGEIIFNWHTVPLISTNTP